MDIRAAYLTFIILGSFILLPGCASRFTSAYPMHGSNCDEFHIIQDGGHRAGVYHVTIGSESSDRAVHIGACPDDPETTTTDETDYRCVATRVPAGATSGPLRISQNAGTGILIGLLDSGPFELGEFSVVEPIHGPCNVWSHAPSDSVPAGACLDDRPAPSRVDDPAENFTLVDQNGEHVELCQFYGKVVILKFFTGWCPTCPDDARSMERDFWQVYRDRGLVVLGIAIDGDRPGTDVTSDYLASWGARNDISYPLLANADESAYLQYFGRHEGVPRLVVIDRRMVVRNVDSCLAFVGGCNLDALRTRVEELLAE